MSYNSIDLLTWALRMCTKMVDAWVVQELCNLEHALKQLYIVAKSYSRVNNGFVYEHLLMSHHECGLCIHITITTGYFLKVGKSHYYSDEVIFYKVYTVVWPRNW